MRIEIESLEKSFGPVKVVNGVSLSIEDGELVTLLGPSGCGKTTVLRMLAGLERPTGGRIKLGDSVLSDEKLFVPPHRRGIGMVFQSYALWPNRTVAENVAFPVQIQKHPKAVVNEKVRDALSLVGLSALALRFPHELSGGQQQRVALARAIAQSPKVLLLDEPLSNLDAKLREQMRRDLRELQRRLKLTMVYVTHDRLEALELSHRMAILDGGRLVQIGSPDEIRARPANEFVAHFIS